MWKYIGKEECNEFLLSLKLFNCKDKKKYLNTIYSISNNIENNYKIYKIKKITWLRATLPGGCPPSTIAAKELNFCVRYGNRCILFAIITT